MRTPSTARTYAFRSLRRNARRTALSIAGIGIGCALALFMESLNRGRDELFARMGAYGGAGHVRVVPAGWRERRDPRLRLEDLQADVAAVRQLPGVAAVTVRARSQSLLAMGTHVVPLEIVGVDPLTERSTNRFVRTVTQGRYLEPSDTGAIVIGQAIADRLVAGLDDEILATAVGRNGRIESMLLTIVGIVRTGNDEVDTTISHVVLGDVERLTGLGGAGEIVVILDDWERADAARAALARTIRIDDVMTWGEISPEFKGHLEQDSAVSRLVSGIILLIVALGVASAQLAAVLERRREFAVLSALGMRGTKIVAVLLQEALAIGIASAGLGLVIGLPFVWLVATRGIDLSRYMGTSYSFQGVLIEPIVIARGVTKTFQLGRQEVKALRGIDLEVRAGEFLALVGPSGSGKTTLLNLVGALDVPSSGELRVLGRPIAALSRRERADLRLHSIGFVFQAFNLVPVLTAVENVEFVLDLQKFEHGRDRARAVLQELGLAELADRRPGELSGGQQQRVAVARAIAARPALVLADEPTANLDGENAEILMHLMRDLRDRHGMTFIFSTHDPRVVAHAVRVVTLVDGCVARDEITGGEPPHELLSRAGAAPAIASA